MSDLMNTQEVAAYLRIKERKIYDLVRQGGIPCTRVGGKWLFPKDRIDQWLERAAPVMPEHRARATAVAPRVMAGSHDPFLEWCVASSGCGLAMLSGGSLDGLERLAVGQAAACGIHILDPESGTYNVPVLERTLPGHDIVAVEWAWREQGLVVAPGNPHGIASLEDVAAGRVKMAIRPPGSGARVLMDHLLDKSGILLNELSLTESPVRSELEVGLTVLDGRADTGLAVRAIARQLRLDFVPLHRERYDLIVRRRDYFEPEMQALLTHSRSADALAKADDLQGYDLSSVGRVWYNAP
ncbi:excisionase family DNA binding protein [Skermanella aerolata]|uniref:substrate-binding domain-containing protein n=1 Tax=Skermanella aerolata TaxID=393310 RepID=UPI003D1C968D